MDQQTLKELLHLQPDEISEPTPFCPSGSELAARFQGQQSAADQERLERHLADCSYCRAQVAVLGRFLHIVPDARVPETLFAQANQLGNRTPSRRSRIAPYWAAAAVAVVALAVILAQNPGPDTNAVGDGQSSAGEPPSEVRNYDLPYQGPAVMSPADGSRIRPDELALRWTEVPGSLYYDVRLVDAQGFVVWRNRVKELSASPPSDLQLVPGERYFVRVDAYLAEAKRVGSNHVTFIYEGQN